MTRNTSIAHTSHRPDLDPEEQVTDRERPADRLGDLPQRIGPRPETGPVAHGQLNQNGPSALQEALWTRMTELDGVRPGPSGISAPATRAVHLDPALALGPQPAFIIGTEFAHLHGTSDGSLHATLPETHANIAIDHGWGELHPIARAGQRPPTLMMLYSPRDTNELENVWRLVQASYAFARGDWDSEPKRSAGQPSAARASNDEGPCATISEELLP
jgi:hypothetical protein